MDKTGIQISRERRGVYAGRSESFSRWYAETKGLHLLEEHSVTAESDFVNGSKIRESFDNGRTWGEPRDIYGSYFEKVGETDELIRVGFDPKCPDPVSGNMVTCGLLRYFIGGHIAAYKREWGEVGDDARDHSYLVYRRPDGTLHQQMIQYEEGQDYDPNDPRNPAYLDHNLSYFGPINYASNGDLLFAVGANVRACCRILGLDIQDVFPSCPQIMCGVFLVRAHWLEQEERYELTYSRPAVISDTLSSRGVAEPCVCELLSGRIVIVFRGSNGVYPNWHTRISPAAPGFKWYIVSDDGGKTFTQPMPWHFDTREVVYSSATISSFFRSSKNGKTYWVGNITDPKTTNGNYPRFPLQICQVEDEYGYLLKDTLTEIDTRHPGESDEVQLSNFNLLENRETLELEVRLTKVCQKGAKAVHEVTEAWTYSIRFDD